MSSYPPSNPPPGWHPDPGGTGALRWWDGQNWTDQMSQGGPGQPAQAALPVRKYNQRMAQRMAKRAKVGEEGVAVAFAYNNLATAVTVGVIEDIARLIPSVGDLIEMAISIATFYFHRIVLVTDQNVYVFRDWPFHIPGERLAAYTRHAGVVQIGSPNPGRILPIHTPRSADLRRRPGGLSRLSLDSPGQVHRSGGEHPASLVGRFGKSA